MWWNRSVIYVCRYSRIKLFRSKIYQVLKSERRIRPKMLIGRQEAGQTAGSNINNVPIDLVPQDKANSTEMELDQQLIETQLEDRKGKG